VVFAEPISLLSPVYTAVYIGSSLKFARVSALEHHSRSLQTSRTHEQLIVMSAVHIGRRKTPFPSIPIGIAVNQALPYGGATGDGVLLSASQPRLRNKEPARVMDMEMSATNKITLWPCHRSQARGNGWAQGPLSTLVSTRCSSVKLHLLNVRPR